MLNFYLSVDDFSTLQETRMLVRCKVPRNSNICGNKGGNAEFIRPSLTIVMRGGFLFI